MRTTFRLIWTSFLGSLLAIAFVIAILMVVFSILFVSVSPKKGVIHRHSVLKVDLNHYIPELTDNADAGKWN